MPFSNRAVLIFLVASTGAAIVDTIPTQATAAESAAELSNEVRSTPEPDSEGASVFQNICSTCHAHGVGHAPDPYLLKMMSSRSIYQALTSGAMRAQGQRISETQKIAVVKFLAGPVDAISMTGPPLCGAEASRFDSSQPPPFSGWGLEPTNRRYVARQISGLDAQNVQGLHLKWALAVPGALRMRSQAALMGGAVTIGTQDGEVLSLDRGSGCLRWKFQADAEVRTAIVAAWDATATDKRPLLYFGDLIGNIYALDATDGKLVWKDHADTHPSTTITAAPVVHNDHLYVAVSSIEEGVAGEVYSCCTFRGSIISYDRSNGDRKWQKYLLPRPKLVGKTSSGTNTFGPSGVAVWASPAIDEKRHLLYVATGDNYSAPASRHSDSILALHLESGEIAWAFQATARDAWNVGCILQTHSNCPRHNGPDYDFGASPILATSTDGRQFVIGGQKSGWVYAIDATNGRLAWKKKVGRGGMMAGVYFGMAVRGNSLFVPINDAEDGRRHDIAAMPGLFAIDFRSGQSLWRSQAQASFCDNRDAGCSPGIAAPVTVTDDVVVAGAGDGWLRAYDAATGSVLWQYDTTLPITTVDGGNGRGGSFGGAAGPVIYDGTLIAESGYGFAGRMSGNVLLVFSVK